METKILSPTFFNNLNLKTKRYIHLKIFARYTAAAAGHPHSQASPASTPRTSKKESKY
jgi:hypothetical protein